MPLRVLLDATAIPADRGGVGRYVDDLLPALAAEDLTLAVVAQATDCESFSARVPGAEVVAVPARAASRRGRMLWEQTGLPALARRWRAQVIHSPHYTMPWRSPVPVVVTLHDATFFSHPDVHVPLKRHFFRAATRRAVRRAAALVVPSQATADEVLRFVGGDRRRFHVAHHGVDTARFHPVGDDERRRVAASLGIEGVPYVGFLGTLEPRKNVAALIEGWVRAAAASPDPPALVLAGGRGWDTAVDPAIAAVPHHLTLVRPGYLPLDDLAGFLSGASVLAYPALGEGFGLPVLEAMACGATVLTTRELSLPEVGGDAVAYCGTGAGDIAEGLVTLLGDEGRRRELSRAALARAREFTWERSAATHAAAYRAAVV